MPFLEVLWIKTRRCQNSLKSPCEITLKEHWKSLCGKFLPLRGPLRFSFSDTSLLLSRIFPKDILENGSTSLLRIDIQHNVWQWRSFLNNHVMFSWKTLVLFAFGPKFYFRSSSITFVGPFFTEFLRGGFLEIPLGLIFKFTISKPLGGVLGSITLGIAAGIADSKAICPEWCLLSRTRSDAVFHDKAAGLSLQIPHFSKAPLPLSLASGAGRRFTGEQSFVAVPSVHLSRVRTRGAAGQTSPSP